ncbi:MAG: sigma-54-dependent Fis family transcriptional regulator, partial [Oxalobacteraceae bacterium]
ALRDRREDIASLTQHLLHKFNKRLQKQVRGVSPEALVLLGQYAWPGNIRELENVIERTLLFCERPVIEPSDLPDELHRGAAATRQAGAPADAEPEAAANAGSLKDIVRQATNTLERDLIVRALEETGGNVTHAATLLRISRKGLQNKMKDLNLRDVSDA